MLVEPDSGVHDTYSCSFDYLRKIVGTRPPLPSTVGTGTSSSGRPTRLSAHEWTLLLRTELVIQVLLPYCSAFDAPICATEGIPYRRILHYLSHCIRRDSESDPANCSYTPTGMGFKRRESFSFASATRQLSFTLAPPDKSLCPLSRSLIDRWTEREDASVSKRLRGTAPAAGSS
ncbi:hypothetical protein DL93DRAFT_733069 [Clavulina sp. PMI_390]|nr:hypothetical protein DL93DRAFT_733069 [Clavulina sp. PMI_390]